MVNTKVRDRGTAQTPHPQFFAALDDVADRMLLDAGDQGRAARLPEDGEIRAAFEQAVGLLEQSLAASPRWPLLQEIDRRTQDVRRALQRGRAFEITLADGHRMRVLARSAHQQCKARVVAWKVPRPRFDLLGRIASAPVPDQARILFLLWRASDRVYGGIVTQLTEAVRLANRTKDSVSMDFVKEFEPDLAGNALCDLAEAIVMGQRELPRSLGELADTVARMCSETSSSVTPRVHKGTRAIRVRLREEAVGVGAQRLGAALAKMRIAVRRGRRGKPTYMLPESRVAELIDRLQRPLGRLSPR